MEHKNNARRDQTWRLQGPRFRIELVRAVHPFSSRQTVAEQIERRRESCLLPFYRSMRRWKDRRKELDLILFPGYVFVQMKLKDKSAVLQLPGGVRVVSFDGHPAGEIERFRERLSHSSKIEPYPYLRTGRSVRVRTGPLQGLEQVILGRKESCRLVFSKDVIQRSVGVQLDETDLEMV